MWLAAYQELLNTLVLADQIDPRVFRMLQRRRDFWRRRVRSASARGGRRPEKRTAEPGDEPRGRDRAV
jgi:hypothetical protein